ncbi:MAG: glutathione S-transferase family protein [Kofleriaceae bacterium]
MKVYGHPWSINTRKTLATLAEKGHEVPLQLVMLPKGEHKAAAHLALHPFGKVPVLDDDGYVIYETRAINAYLDATLRGPSLTPATARERARMDQWINVADAYFIPHAHPLLVEVLFRRYLGGAQDQAAIAAGRAGMTAALDAIDRALGETPYLAGDSVSLADIHWSPYIDYLTHVGEAAAFEQRRNVRAWWGRLAARAAWHKVARTGPQPYHDGATQDAIEARYR